MYFETFLSFFLLRKQRANKCNQQGHKNLHHEHQQNHDCQICHAIAPCPLSKKEFNTVLFFINMIGNFNVSRLIYVTNNYDRESIKILAKYTDVTIIITSDDDKNTYERNGDIELVSFGSKRLYQSSHNIEV